MVCGTCEVPWNLRSTIEDINWCATSFEETKRSHVLREANFVMVASLGLTIDNFCIWDTCIPVKANIAFHLDCIETGHVRGFSL